MSTAVACLSSIPDVCRQSHDTSLILSPQTLRDTVDAMLELGYDPTMKDTLLKSTHTLNILCRASAPIRQTADVLRGQVLRSGSLWSMPGEHAVGHK
jgi:hypothetical protein